MKREIVFFEKHFKAAREYFFQEKELESGLIGCAKLSSNSGLYRFIIIDFIFPKDDDYLKRTPTFIEYHPKFMKRIFEQCVNYNCHPVTIHNHPHSIINTTFSHHDNYADTQIMGPYVSKYFRNLYHIGLVCGKNIQSLDARMWSRRLHKLISIPRVKIIGIDSVFIIPTTSALTNNRINYDPVVHNRTILALGAAAQQNYAELTIGLIGSGGLGSIAGELFSRLPVKMIIAVDNDIIDKTTLNRFTNSNPRDAQFKRPKVFVLKRAFKKINPGIKVIPVQNDFLNPEVQEQIKSCDINIGCSDSNLLRLALNRFTLAHGIPYFDLGCGAVVEKGRLKHAGGQIIKIAPHNTFCLHCANYFSKVNIAIELMDDEQKEASRHLGYLSGDIDEKDKTPQLSVYALNMQTASHAVWWIMRYVSGDEVRIDGIGIDAMNHSVKPWIHPENSNKDCPICGENGIVGLGDEAPLMVKQKSVQVPNPTSKTSNKKSNSRTVADTSSVSSSQKIVGQKIDCVV